jgi:acyl carrier protein
MATRKEELTWESCRGNVAAFLGMEPDGIERTTNLFDTLGVDSLGIFSLGVHLISVYGAQVPLSEVSSISTAGDLYDALDRHRGEA